MADSIPTVKSMTGNKSSLLRKDADYSNLLYGRIQPQALPLEEAVLGAIMLDKDALSVVMDVLQSESFYMPSHQVIYKSMLVLFEQNEPIDLLTVHEALKKSGDIQSIGGPQYLVDLSNKVTSAANIEFHARLIAQKHIQRELIRVSTQVTNDSFEDTIDVFQLLDDAEKGLFDITQNNINRASEKLGALAVLAQKQMEELSTKEDGLTGVPSGFIDLDRITSGWQNSDLIIIAARPGMGKTAFTLALARNAAFDYNKGVAIFSLEMSNLQLVQRLISMESEISGTHIRNGKLEGKQWETIHDVIERMADVPIFIDDTPAINIFELRAKCRRLKKQNDISLIVIDYLQLMSAGPDQKRGNREQEISSISRALKSMAKELNVPVIALSQLSRAVETRGGSKRPQLSDLRESGAIEQDADIVTFIYRPDYYELEEDNDTPQGLTEIIIAKHRNGALDTIQLKFVKEYAKFTNLDSIDFESFSTESSFENPYNNIITRPSRLNDDEEIPF
jgi:replicative DNA helicase